MDNIYFVVEFFKYSWNTRIFLSNISYDFQFFWFWERLGLGNFELYFGGWYFEQKKQMEAQLEDQQLKAKQNEKAL